MNTRYQPGFEDVFDELDERENATREKALYYDYRAVVAKLQQLIKQAKTNAQEELLSTIEQDLQIVSHHFWENAGKDCSNKSETLDLTTPGNVLNALFPNDQDEIPAIAIHRIDLTSSQVTEEELARALSKTGKKKEQSGWRSKPRTSIGIIRAKRQNQKNFMTDASKLEYFQKSERRQYWPSFGSQEEDGQIPHRRSDQYAF